MAITIEQIHVPHTLGEDPAGDFHQSAAVSNAVELDTWGHDDFAVDVSERLVMMQASPDRETVLAVARDADRIVADVRLRFPLRDNQHTAHVQIEVLPSHRRRGIATALLALAEEHVVERGRTTIMSWSDTGYDYPKDPPLLLVPPAGAGGFPAADPSAMFAARLGFDLVQVDRQSCLVLSSPSGSLASIGRHEREAASRGTADYELLGWADRCPEELVADYASLRQRMSTDAPIGGFAQKEELWDSGRVRGEEDKVLASGASSLVSAVRHRGSGQLVGHTLLERFASRPAVVYQEDTLVIHGHRGRRLGSWLKSANLRRVHEEWSTAERIYTWNAEENTFMLDVNVALGFRPSGRTAGWQKVLALP